MGGNIRYKGTNGEEIEGQSENGRDIGIFSHFFPDSKTGYIIQYPYGYYYKYQNTVLGRDYLGDGYTIDQDGTIVALEMNHVDNLSFDELEIALLIRKQDTHRLKNKHKKKEITKKRQDALKTFLEKI